MLSQPAFHGKCEMPTKRITVRVPKQVSVLFRLKVREAKQLQVIQSSIGTLLSLAPS